MRVHQNPFYGSGYCRVHGVPSEPTVYSWTSEREIFENEA
jgi:hypothetical protein